MDNNFKRFQCDDGKEYFFNYKAFKTELKRAASLAKKEGLVTSIEAFKEGLAEEVAVSISAIKQWETGRNGVSDLERVKEIAAYLGLGNYMRLLTEQKCEDRKELQSMSKCYLEEERNMAREVFYGFAEVVKAFKDTEGYAACLGMYTIPTNEEVLEINDRLELLLQKSRFDLGKEVWENLTYLFYEITSILPEEIKAENSFKRSMKIEEMADEFYEKVCDILKGYMK